MKLGVSSGNLKNYFTKKIYIIYIFTFIHIFKHFQEICILNIDFINF